MFLRWIFRSQQIISWCENVICRVISLSILSQAVLHDDDLALVCNDSRRVRDLTVAQLKQIDAGTRKLYSFLLLLLSITKSFSCSLQLQSWGGLSSARNGLSGDDIRGGHHKHSTVRSTNEIETCLLLLSLCFQSESCHRSCSGNRSGSEAKVCWGWQRGEREEEMR